MHTATTATTEPAARSPDASGLAAAALTGAGLILTAPPGLTWLDAGELGAAAAELGVAHPPGFAAFVLGHHAVMKGLPLGDLAFRGNVASALVAAAAVWALAGAGRALGLRAWAAALGALLSMTAPLAMLHGQTIEVYSGLGLWLGLMVTCAARARAEADGRWALGAGLLAGLALGHHPELRLVVPLALLAGAPLLRRPRVVVGAVLAGLVGAMVVALLPLRSEAGLWRDWGHPAHLGALWDHLSGLRIRAAYADRFFSFELADLTLYLEQTLRAAPVLALAGLVGMVRLARRPVGWLVAATWFVDLVYSVGLNPMGLVDRQNGVLGLAALGIGAAASLDGLALWLRARMATTAALGGEAVVGSVVLMAGLGGALWAPEGLGVRAADRGLPRLLGAALDDAPPEAVAMVVSDSFAAGLAFAQVAEGARPDVAVVVRQHAWDASSIDPVRRRLPHALPDWQPRPPAVAVGAIVAEVGARNPRGLRWEWGRDLDAAERPPDLVPRFPWFAPAAAPNPEDLPRFMAAMGRLIAQLGPEGLAAVETRRGLAQVVSDLGFHALGRGDQLGAVRALEAAAGLDSTSSGAQTNLSQARLRAGDVPGATAAAEAALTLAPTDAAAALNLARILVNYAPADGRLADLLAQVLDAGLVAQQADAHTLLGVLAGNRGDLATAGAHFAEAVALVPGHAEATAGLAQVRRQQGAGR